MEEGDGLARTPEGEHVPVPFFESLQVGDLTMVDRHLQGPPLRIRRPPNVAGRPT